MIPLSARSAAAALLLGAAATAAALQPAHPEYVPNAVEAIICVRDAGAVWEALSQSASADNVRQWVGQERIQMSDSWARLETRLDKLRDEAGVDLWPDSLLGEQIQGLDLYLVEPEIYPELVVVTTFADAEYPTRILDRIREEARESRGVSGGYTAGAIDYSEIGSYTVTSLQAFELHLVSSGATLIWSTNIEALRSALESRGRPFLRSPEFLEFTAPLPSRDNAQVWFYGDPGRIAALFAETLDPNIRAATEQVAGDRTAGTMTFASDYVRITSFRPISVMPPITQRFALAAPEPGEQEALRFVSPEVFGFWATNAFDALSLLEWSMASMDGVPGLPITRRELEQQLTNSRTMYGFDLRNDLLANLGPDLALAIRDLQPAAPDAVTPLPTIDLLLVTGVKDPARYERVMDQVEGMITSGPGGGPEMLQQEEYRGAVINFVNQPALAAANVQPSYCLTADNYLLVAFRPSVIREALDDAAGDGNLLARSSTLDGVDQLAGATNEFGMLNLEGLFQLMLSSPQTPDEPMDGPPSHAILDGLSSALIGASYLREGALTEVVLGMK